MGGSFMSSVKGSCYPNLGLVKVANTGLGRNEFQEKSQKAWSQGSAMNGGWRLCKKFIFWAVMEGCLIAVGIDDLIDCAEFSLTEETNKQFARITSKELVISKVKRPHLQVSVA